MASELRSQGEWVDGFLFVGNHLALDFLNTKPKLEGEARELLPNTTALERWLITSGIITSQKDRTQVRAWRGSYEGEVLVQKLIAFRERLRAAVLRLERGLGPGAAFVAEMNMLLREHPQPTRLSRHGSKLELDAFWDLREPSDIWVPIIAAIAELLSGLDPSRIRKCEAESCVVHFYDTSKKGSRRWCSMNICGNRLKVAAYQRRRRLA